MTDEQHLADDPAEVSTIDSLRSLALEHGFDYRDADATLVDRWGAPPFPSVGHRRALDVVTGERGGFPVVAFRFVVAERDRTAGAQAGFGGGVKLAIPEVFEQYVVVAAALPSPLPRFALAPREGAIDEVPFGDVFECEDPGLAERYDVYAADPGTAGAVLHLDAVEKIRAHRDLDWRVEGRDIIAVEQTYSLERSAEEILETLDAVVAIAAGIDTDAYARYKAPAGYPPSA
ncbi:MAG: hypothetical protein ACRDT4_16700 [Micromonosporaceae bacterium]